MSCNKEIRRYTIVDENNKPYASFLDQDAAVEWLQAVAKGYMIKRGWRGTKYRLEERSTQINKAARILFF